MILLPVDTRLVSVEHGFLFVISFLAVNLLLLVLWHWKIQWFQVHQKNIFYAGIFLIAVISILASIQLPMPLSAGLLISTLLISIAGRWDEHFKLSPAIQLVFQSLAALSAITLGWNIIQITHVGGEGVISLAWFNIGPWLFPASLITLIWLVFLMNAINWLDGVDGLSGSVVGVAFATLAGISLLPATQDEQTLVLSLIGLGAVVAFLFWNWSPARMYLGTTGSWFLGLYVGLVALIGGGKIATTILVLAVPLVDVVLVILQRLINKQAPWKGDTTWHLHFHLLHAGVSPQRIALLAIAISIVAGSAAVTLQTSQKISLFILVAFILTTGVGLLLYRKRRISKKV